ncbi:DUF3265 domain-containing protein [Vibrio parahaemolyticus]|nr:DUF3265 domain-containing protein [Vibrio parahaemolyticus]
MRNAWHFHFKSVLVIKAVISALAVALSHPLTRR